MAVIKTSEQSQHDLAHDEQLSAEAVGVATYLLSKPEDWEIHTTDIMRRFGMGDNRLKRIIRELKTAGYLSYHRQKGAGGRYAHGGYVFTDCPATDKQARGVK